MPQGEYDSEATAFVQLPPDMSPDGAPLEAPGHGYVPAEAWAAHDPNATSQWNFQEAPAPAVPAPAPAPSELTGQWTIPVAQGDLPDESGEFNTSALASQWTSGNPPATLPGGAAAPWATAAPTPEDPAQEPAQEPGRQPAPEPDETASQPAPPRQEAQPESPETQAQEPQAQEPQAQEPQAQEPQAPDAPAPDPQAEEPQVSQAPPTHVTDSDEHPHISYVLRVNGTDRPVTEAWIGESLLYVLRERLGLAGAKDGCSQGECGACNVQVDGRLVASCLVPAATAAGSEVRTVEGLATDGEPSDVQRALARCGAVQCGFCIPGMAMTVHDLLEGNHAPSELETRQALCGNLCRCTGYRGVLDAVREVVAGRAASAAAEAAGAAEATEEGAGQARIPHQIPHPHDGGMA
ncbi:2Fe-2S iron-sulfur cluster-binding protein [Streptomyces ficellus]|uniref:2Fe-2S iron-sulfur cluster-binding protein n=1 Tax=Streptomyces ficellus TaxID=1977088 RepID=A0ABT7Z2F1_9ACTN|nr:2Fe-2S iron-sulfur cluster-binding protein [Streptomyces ficellus]MDN3293669.1 2Fe-2S iron-sulfur cluster-binding protein [Streptomyces ficellus]